MKSQIQNLGKQKKIGNVKTGVVGYRKDGGTVLKSKDKMKKSVNKVPVNVRPMILNDCRFFCFDYYGNDSVKMDMFNNQDINSKSDKVAQGKRSNLSRKDSGRFATESKFRNENESNDKYTLLSNKSDEAAKSSIEMNRNHYNISVNEPSGPNIENSDIETMQRIRMGDNNTVGKNGHYNDSNPYKIDNKFSFRANNNSNSNVKSTKDDTDGSRQHLYNERKRQKSNKSISIHKDNHKDVPNHTKSTKYDRLSLIDPALYNRQSYADRLSLDHNARLGQAEAYHPDEIDNNNHHIDKDQFIFKKKLSHTTHNTIQTSIHNTHQDSTKHPQHNVNSKRRYSVYNSRCAHIDNTRYI